MNAGLAAWLVDTKVHPNTHGDLDGDVPGTSNGSNIRGRTR